MLELSKEMIELDHETSVLIIDNGHFAEFDD
jgi:hypothetical protein